MNSNKATTTVKAMGQNQPKNMTPSKPTSHAPIKPAAKPATPSKPAAQPKK